MGIFRSLCLSVLILFGLDAYGQSQTGQPQNAIADLEFFERKVRPILSERCYECHSSRAKRIEGGLRLDHSTLLSRGGDSGSVIDGKNWNDSLLLRAIRYEDYEMPPSGKLSEAEIDVLTEWVQRGTPWPEEAIPEGSSQKLFDLEQRKASHWIWKPLSDPTIPDPSNMSSAKNGIDAFIQAKLKDHRLTPASQADRGTLVRRLSWDLLGLPPSSEFVQRWVNDSSPDWYEQCLDSILADPQFGVRFGRHWLDLVRYAQSRGHEFDEDIPGAEHYRDYVIRAWNSDLPYDQFVKEHVAGDLIGSPRRHPVFDWNESVLGTGYWFLGEWVHSPVDTRKDETDRFDNMVDVFSKTFLGLTVSCARCHDHKFDALSTEDYYALYGFLRSSHYRLVRFETDKKESQIWRELESVRTRYRTKFAEALRNCRCKDGEDWKSSELTVPRLLPAADFRVKLDSRTLDPGLFRANGQAFGDRVTSAGFQGCRLEIDPTNQAIRLRMMGLPTISADPFWFNQKSIIRRTNAGNKHSQVDLANKTYSTPSFVLDHDHLSFLVRGSFRAFVSIDSHRLINGPLHSETIFESKADNSYEFRWVTGSNLARYRGKRVHVEFSPIAQGGFDLLQMIGGDVPQEAKTQSQILSLAHCCDEPNALGEETGTHDQSLTQALAWEQFFAYLRNQNNHSETIAMLERITAEWMSAEEAIKQRLPLESKVAMAMQDGSGQDDFLLIRGNTDRLGHVVPRRFLEAMGGKSRPISATKGSGRLELAEQMLADDNPMVARVFANRVWHHLVGRGIVATTDDFGIQGKPPTHPELLDYLGRYLRDKGWSPKALIRLICLSHTYRQQAGHRGLPASDMSNELLSYANVRKLEGEAVRDGLLAVAGQLDVKLDNASVPVHLTDFMTGRGRPQTSGPLHGEGRRSIFLEVRRNFLNPMLSAFDMPNPFSAMGRRNASNVPAQALTMINDPLLHWLSQRWAERESRIAETDETRIKRMIEAAKGRLPHDEEIKLSLEFVASEREAQTTQSHNEKEQAVWSSFAHALLNSKELMFRF